MASGAALLLEDALPAARAAVERIRIRRWLEGVYVKSESVELLVAETGSVHILRSRLKIACAVSCNP
jgi:hypothetical protein